MDSRPLKFAVIGTGFWARYQIPAWFELEGIELVALYNRTKSKAEELAHQYQVPRVYDDVDQLLDQEELDFVDIITDVETHAPLTMKAATRGVSVICQKPMASDLKTAHLMISTCNRLGIPLYIHENWRWQAPIRQVKRLLNDGLIGKIFKARVTFCSGFPVFDNQPFLATLKQFILTDIGSHILDVCRFLLGEVDTLWCQTSTVNQSIQGEDVANVMMKMKSGVTCYAEMSYASILEYEPFPQTFILIEGENGSIHLTRDFRVLLTTREGTTEVVATPPFYVWADPAYALVHSSIVDCNRDILDALKGNKTAETTGADNFETTRLVHASYASASSNALIRINDFVA